jgi:Family of unknown function (DUF5302)
MSDTAAPAGPDQPGSDAGTDNEVKDKFRQALERKRGHQADRDAAADHLSGSKIGGEHASAKTKRTFRRKSG